MCPKRTDVVMNSAANLAIICRVIAVFLREVMTYEVAIAVNLCRVNYVVFRYWKEEEEESVQLY